MDAMLTVKLQPNPGTLNLGSLLFYTRGEQACSVLEGTVPHSSRLLVADTALRNGGSGVGRSCYSSHAQRERLTWPCNHSRLNDRDTQAVVPPLRQCVFPLYSPFPEFLFPLLSCLLLEFFSCSMLY